MTESTYDPCLFYRSGLLEIVTIQTNNTLILANNTFASKEDKAVRNAKIMTKDQEYLTPAELIKFNEIQIKLDSNNIVLLKINHVGGMLPVIDHDADSTYLKGIIRKRLLPKEKYLVQRASGAYIASIG